MNHLGEQVTAILTAIVGVAILAVILSRNSNTSNVIASAAEGFSMALGTAVSPITGAGGGSFGVGGFNANYAGGGFTSGFNSGIPALRGFVN